MSTTPRTAKATEAAVTARAFRAAGDPDRLERATRIVRAALASDQLTLADLTPLPLRRTA